ncbi:MAG: hypothetical protein BWY47_01689 [Bacteroidetes bacterium ADurb.Bin302]|nr:MAG: hypothetical protein BWY47_01689 [Bacteroidetes bacterium ADurb.Bin302]
MAITGTGTVNDPYLVNSYTDLRNVCGDGTRTGGTDVWCKLMVDINCNEACPTGWSAVKMNMNFDLNGHKIIAPLCKDGVSLFYCDMTSIYGSFIIKNGEIINIFEEYTATFVGSGKYPFFRGAYVRNSGTCEGYCEFRIENMGLSIYVRNRPCIVNSQQGSGCSGSCYNSTIKLSGDLRSYTDGSQGFPTGTIFSPGTFQNCRFILNDLKTNIYNALWMQSHNGDPGRTPPVSSCRVDGRTKGALNLGSSNIVGETGKLNNGLLKDMFIAVDEGKEEGWNDQLTHYYSNGKSIFVKFHGGHESFTGNRDNNFVGVTDAVAKDVEDLNDTGFITIEVT